MRWARASASDPYVRALRDRHYAGGVGGRTVGQPGRRLVLRTVAGDAGWITCWPELRYVRHEWGDAWTCTLFRNESGFLSSEIIREAVSATRHKYGEIPSGGFLTFVDASKVRRKRDPGRCFLRAGFKRVGLTKDRELVVLHLGVGDFPEAEAPLELRPRLFDGVAA